MDRTNYAIDDGNGNQITAGLQEHNARKVAQRIANERGEAVFLYPIPSVEGDDAETIEPERKDDVGLWDTETTYVTTYPADDGEGACDVEVQVGEAGGRWYLRTVDDAGGSDEADDTAYPSEDAARAAARAFAAERDEGDGEDAEGYLAAKLAERAGEPCTDGEWCVYWSTVGDDSHVVDRYATEEQARAAAEIASDALHRSNPGHLLCGYEVRTLVDGVWTYADEVSR